MATIPTAQQTAISNRYVALFNRAPDVAGFEFWLKALSNGASLGTITASFLSSPEAMAAYPVAQTSEQFVATFYQTVFGRAADTGGLAFWTNVLNGLGGSGSDAAKAELVSKIITLVSTPLATQPADLTNLQYGQTVADRDLFMKKSVRGIEFGINGNSNDLGLATKALLDVVPNVPTAPVAPSVPGDPFTLTAAIDGLTGTPGDDIFTADNTNPAARTMVAGDFVDGLGGIDTLRYLAAAVDTNLSLGTLVNLEKLYVNGGGALTANISAIGGLTDAEFDTIGGPLTVTLAGSQVVTITANNGAAVQAVNLNYGAATAAQLVLNGSGKAGTLSTMTVAGASLTVLKVSATGASDSFIQLNSGALLTGLIIAGNKNITVNESITTLTGINASGATGNVTLTHGGNAVIVNAGLGADTISVSGGSTVIFAAGTFTASDHVTFIGGGTLQINNAPNYALINAATGATTLAVNFANNVDAAQVTNPTVTGFSFLTASGNTNLINAADGGTLSLLGGGNTTVDLVAGSSSFNVTLNNTAATPGVKTVSVLQVNAMNITLTSSGATSAHSNVLTDLGYSSGATITIQGAADLTLRLASSAGTANASTFTGKLNVTGSTTNDIIIGSSGNDIISGASGADTLTGGAGNDLFVFTSTATTHGAGFAATNTTAANIDRITDFSGNGAGLGDSVSFGIAANQFGTALQFTVATAAAVTALTVASAADFTALATAMQTASAGVASTAVTAQLYDVTVSAGSLAGHYLVLNNEVGAITATDTFILITGVTGAVNAQDLVFA